jgi:hypothetical protein
MAELTINWETLQKLPPLEPVTTTQDAPVITESADTLPTDGTTDEGSPASEAPKPTPVKAEKKPVATSGFKPADRPYMIYVADEAASAAAGFDTVTKVVLDDDRVKLGAKAFHAVKMTDADAKADPVLAEKGGKELPRVIFVTNDLKSVKVFEGGSLKLGEVWGGMKLTAGRAFKNDLDTLVRSLKEVLVEFDKINAERNNLEAKEKRDAAKATSADVKEIAAKRAALDVREKKAVERKDALWELKPKA